MVKRNVLLLLALLIVPSLAAMEKFEEDLKRKDPLKAVENEPESDDFEEKLFAALKKHRLVGIERDGIRIFRKISSLNSDDAKKTLNELTNKDVPYMLPAIAIAKVMNDTMSFQLLYDAFALHKKKIGTMNEKEEKMYEKYKQYLPKKPDNSLWEKFLRIIERLDLD